MRIIFFFILVGTLLVNTTPLRAEQEAPLVEAPQTIKEAQNFGLQILQGIPGAVKEVWETQALPLWTKMWQITKNILDTYVFSWMQNLWNQFLSLFHQEIEKRKPLIQDEFEKEKAQLQQELQEKLPGGGKTLWEQIKGFLPGQ